jgi:hypothetical protein
MADFVERAREEYLRLQAEERALAAQEEGVRRRRAALQSRLTSIENAVVLYQELTGQTTVMPEPDVGASNGLRMGTIVDMAAQVIERSGGRAKMTKIVEELERAGKLKPSEPGDRNNYATVYGTLRRSRRLHKADKGEWELAQ